MTRRQEIMGTALGLMRKKGYLNTSMRDIASSVNMEAASLYNHIKGKEEILIDTCFGLAETLEIGIKEVNDIYFNAAEKLSMAIHSHIKDLTQDLNASHLFVHEWRHLSDDKRAQFIERRDLYEKEFRDIVILGFEEGEFKDVDPKFATLTILASLNWVGEWYRPQGEMQPKEIAEKLTHFILSGLQNN
jgi:AcrR family transcriptional regulator